MLKKISPVRLCQVPSILEMRVPKELKRVETHGTQAMEPGTMWRHFSDQVVLCSGDPSCVLKSVKNYMKADDDLDVRFLIQAFGELGSTFDFNSFWSSSDKQNLTSNLVFKWLISDLIEQKSQISVSSVPVIVYALACLEYRPARLLDPLVEIVRLEKSKWTLPVLSNLAFSLAMLNCEDNLIVAELLTEAKVRFGTKPDAGNLHDWSQLAFSNLMGGTNETMNSCLGVFLKNATSKIRTKAQLDRSGWAQFFLYQINYAVDAPSALPDWVKDHLHHRWISGSILATCQPQGADQLQMDVDQVLKRTNTNAILNCSAGRDTDEQHCWFVGHKLAPKIAIEYNSNLPSATGEQRPSGWTNLKTRILQKCGYSVAVINKNDWDKLDDKQKDQQIVLLKNQLGYVHEETAKTVTPTGGRSLKPGAVRWEDQPDWVPHMREPELHFTVQGYKPKDNPNFKGGIQVNKRRKYIANGNHNWVNSLSPKG